MSRKILVLSAVIAAFGMLSAKALLDHGYRGIIAYHLHSTAGWQVYTDLVIVCVLAIFWMLGDARRTGRNAWPYVVATVFAGSFGPLFYLLVGELSARKAEPGHA